MKGRVIKKESLKRIIKKRIINTSPVILVELLQLGYLGNCFNSFSLYYLYITIQCIKSNTQ
jgi:DUF1365 family protein